MALDELDLPKIEELLDQKATDGDLLSEDHDDHTDNTGSHTDHVDNTSPGHVDHTDIS
jgi:hypothetical protein